MSEVHEWNCRTSADQHRAICTRADLLLHFDLLKLNKLLGGQPHFLPVSVIRRRTTGFCCLALILSEFALLLGDSSLLLGRSLDTLVLDRVRWVNPSNIDCRAG